MLTKKILPSIADLIAKDKTALPAAVDLQGWNSDHPIFDQLVEETQPRVIIEVGAWKGRSARHLSIASSGLKDMDQVSGTAIPMGTRIYCVDTWLGGVDHFMSSKPQDNLMPDANGSPQLYHQFLRNFADDPDLARRIFPIQNTSLNGARILAHMGIQAELIYVDGSHEYHDAYSDLCAFAQLLAPGGVMFGDDFRSFAGVFAAVMRFAHEGNFKIEEVANNYWVLRAAPISQS